MDSPSESCGQMSNLSDSPPCPNGKTAGNDCWKCIMEQARKKALDYVTKNPFSSYDPKKKVTYLPRPEVSSLSRKPNKPININKVTETFTSIYEQDRNKETEDGHIPRNPFWSMPLTSPIKEKSASINGSFQSSDQHLENQDKNMDIEGGSTPSNTLWDVPQTSNADYEMENIKSNFHSEDRNLDQDEDMFDGKSDAAKLNIIELCQINKIRDALQTKFLENKEEEGNTNERPTAVKRSRVLLREKFIECPVPFKKKRSEATPEELKFFKLTQAIIEEDEPDFTSKDFTMVYPDIEVATNFFLEYICSEYQNCREPKILVKFLALIAAFLSNPKVILSCTQLGTIIKFLLHCIFVGADYAKHLDLCKIAAQMLTIFTNGPSIISKTLYEDVVTHFKQFISNFPIELHHWNAILLTVQFMGISAIQSILMKNISQIYDLFYKSLNSLQHFQHIPFTFEGSKMTEKEINESKNFKHAIHTYINASIVRSQVLKLYEILIEDFIKEDIRTDPRMLYISNEISDLLVNESNHIIKEPEIAKSKYDSDTFKHFVNSCSKYFGAELSARTLSVCTKYEKNNYLKAQFFQQKLKLFPLRNRYVTSKIVRAYENYKKQDLEKRNRNKIVYVRISNVHRKHNFYNRTCIYTTPLYPQLGSLLTFEEGKKVVKLSDVFDLQFASKPYQDESQSYVSVIKKIPHPWLHVLRTHYIEQSKLEPLHWKYTGNLATYLK